MTKFLSELGETYDAIVLGMQRERMQSLEVATASLEVLDINLNQLAKEQGKTVGSDSQIDNTFNVLADQPRLNITEVARQQDKAVAGDSAQVAPVESAIPYDMAPHYEAREKSENVIAAQRRLDEAYAEYLPPKVNDWSNN